MRGQSAALCGLAMWVCTLWAGTAWAQSTDAPGPVGGAPAALPEIRLPSLSEAGVTVPRTVRATQALLGQGRQRLALVIGIGTVGTGRVVETAGRDAQAVAAALRLGGFVVMLREDIAAADLRASLKEFRDRLQPGGIGLLYFSGLGAHVDGRNLVLARDAPLDTGLPAVQQAQRLAAAGVTVDDLALALIGPAGSPRLLVVDAAYRNPALAALPQAGLAEPRLPQGEIALFAQALGSWQDLPAVAALPEPPPTDPRDIAASRFARVLTAALLTPRISGSEALRSTRRAIADASLGQASPWLGGDTDDSEDLAEVELLDSLVPRTPAELAQQGLRPAARLLKGRPVVAGEQSVAEVLKGATTPAPLPPSSERDSGPRGKPEPSGSSGLAQAANAVAAATGVAATAAVVGSALAASEMPAALSAAGSAAGLAGRALAQGATGSADLAPLRATALAAPTTPVVPVAPAVPANQAMPRPPTAALAAAAPAAVATQATPAKKPLQDGRTVNNPGGGERPAYQPRRNLYGHAEGDTYSFRRIDTWKDKEIVVDHTITAIEEVLEDGTLFANGRTLQMDAQGRLQRQTATDGSVTVFEPAEAFWWPDAKRGESRDLRFTETLERAGRQLGRTEWTGSSSVGKPRMLELPAGEFEVLPIESSGWATRVLADGTRQIERWSRTVWMSPKLGHPVAIDIEDVDRGGRLLRRERVELVHAQSARNAP